MAKVQTSALCPACNTPLSRERWSEGLCPGCALELALEDSSLEAEVLLDPEEAPTLQYSGYTFEEGQIQGERYRIRSILGRGGMGEVWRAYDLKLRQDVALKALRSELIQDQEALETLRQEVRTAREVISPNVCRVFDLQELDGQELVSMEYIDGTTLQEILKERSPLDLDEAREIASQFLAGLEAIHDAGLVHRDIKPENVMVTRTGRVVVMDFGIAKGLGDGNGGLIAGTPAYMSPEQTKGEDLDARSDVFSTGVVLAEMVAPDGVHSLEDRQQVWEAIHQAAPVIDETPWSRVIRHCVSPEQEDRYASAAELARALEEVTLRAVGDETARPYPGLASFQEDDAEYFYGRELEVEALWKKLRQPHLLAVIGPSGAGKSSFLRAGLLPTLTDGWQALIATPGNRPFSNLEQALGLHLGEAPGVAELLQRFEEPEIALELLSEWRQRSRHALLIVDQFEELFTQNPDDVQQQFAEFLGRLPLDADLFVLLSMRDDFLMHCHRFEALQPVFSELSPLDPPLGAALRRALVQPALKCGYRFEDESIVEEMLGEVEGQRGALPLLAFAAAQLWERRDRETGLLTCRSYEQIGGVSGALAQHAEAILDYIGESNVPIVRELFRNLVSAQGTRATRDRDDLLSVFPDTEGEPFLEPSRVEPTPTPRPHRPAAKHVLNSLIDARLLTSYEVRAEEDGGEPRHQIEIVHESLLARWPRLVRWQRQDADSAQIRDELRNQAQLWQEHGHSEDYLWTGTAFKDYELWRERYPGGLTATEEAFGAAMVHLAERQKRRRRIVVAVVIAVLLVGLTVVGSFWRQAERETRRAEAGKLIALGELEINTYPTAALAWATKSLEVSDTLEGRLLALRALQRESPVTVMSGQGGTRLAFSPSGEWFAIAGTSRVELHHQGGGDPIVVDSFDETRENIKVVFATDDVLVTEQNGDMRWWSVPEGKELRRSEGDRGRLQFPRGDGYFNMTAEEDGQESIYWWPLGEGDSRLVGSMEPWWWGLSDIDQSGSWLAYPRDKTVYLRSLEDWSQPPLLLGEHTEEVWRTTFHPSGEVVASQDASGEVRFWSTTVTNAKPLRVLQAGQIQNITFDPSGSWLAGRRVLDGRPTVRLWDLAAPQHTDPLTLSRTDAFFSQRTSFHPSQPWLVNSSNVSGVGFWPLTGLHPWVLRGGQEGFVVDVAFTADSEWLVSEKASGGGGIRAWPLQGQNDGASRILLDRSPAPYGQFAIHPSGEHLAVLSSEGTMLIVPLGGGPVRELPGWDPSSDVRGIFVAFSPNGRLLAAVPGHALPEEKVIRVWDLTSGEARTLSPVTGYPSFLGFDDDRRLRWVGSAEPPAEGIGEQVYDLADGSVEIVADNSTEFARAVSSRETFMLVLDISRGEDKPEIYWKDLASGESRHITSHGAKAEVIAIDPSDRWMVTGSSDGLVRIGPISGEEPHLLYGHRGLVRDVAVSPDSRWIASGGDDGTVRLWPMPDMSKPPLHTLPHDELIAKLHSLTNLRIVEDPESSTGWKLDYAPFPGWAEVPEW